MGAAAGRLVAFLDQRNKGTGSNKSAASSDAGELRVSRRYFRISNMCSGVSVFVNVGVRLVRPFVFSRSNTIVSKVRD